MNIPSDGFSVGNLSTTTISGTVPYRSTMTLVRNGQIKLWTVTGYGTQQEQRTLIFTWFLKDCTVYNESSVTFTGVDAMAFTSNNYAIGRNVNQQVDTVGTQVQVAGTTISGLCGATVTIDASSYSFINNLRPPLDTNKWTNGIKNLMQSIAKYDCVNYYTVCGQNSITLTKTSWSEIDVSSYEYAPLTLGVSSNTVAGVRVKQDKSAQFAPTQVSVERAAHKQTTPQPEDYGIYETGNVGMRANTLEIDTPYISDDSPKSHFANFIGRSFGTQFSCNNVPVPYNEFFIPMARIRFTGDNNEPYYYICSANYVLTKQGIYASVSGTARSISDYDYVGKTEKQLRGKLAMEYNYSGTIMTQDGIQFVAQAEVDANPINSSAAADLGHKDIYGVIPLGKGLFGLGNDIVCSSPLLSKDESHKNDTPVHMVTYEYTDFYIDIAWTETIQGKMENIQWTRRWKT